MNARGFTLAEVLVTGALGSIVLLGLFTAHRLYSNLWADSDSQAYLQRQGALILREMAWQVRPASKPLTMGVCNPDPNSLGGSNSEGAFCFYSSGGQLFELRPSSAVGPRTFNLLSGTPVALSVLNVTSSLSPDLTTASVRFQLKDARGNTMTFATSLSTRN